MNDLEQEEAEEKRGQSGGGGSPPSHFHLPRLTKQQRCVKYVVGATAQDYVKICPAGCPALFRPYSSNVANSQDKILVILCLTLFPGDHLK